MIIECTLEGGTRLAEPFDFRSFKIVMKGGASTKSNSWQGITFVDEDNALVSINLVPALPGRRAEDRAWEAAYENMVAKAREHGWIDMERNAIRAHVERER